MHAIKTKKTKVFTIDEASDLYVMFSILAG
ncbi:hypothetical protein CoNPh26_CDS0065 [Staphylococcus phage S-CoN_Ph26]|nr:hypothetical protein CoNPh26_CDS0065 [Staphylococcus phage S-CoN_Ph26]